MSFLDVCAGSRIGLSCESQFATLRLTRQWNTERSPSRDSFSSWHEFSAGDLLYRQICGNLVALELAVKRCAADPQQLASLCFVPTHLVNPALDGQTLEFFERYGRRRIILDSIRGLHFPGKIAAKQRGQ